jgi:hypothetical protein
MVMNTEITDQVIDAKPSIDSFAKENNILPDTGEKPEKQQVANGSSLRAVYIASPATITGIKDTLPVHLHPVSISVTTEGGAVIITSRQSPKRFLE